MVLRSAEQDHEKEMKKAERDHKKEMKELDIKRDEGEMAHEKEMKKLEVMKLEIDERMRQNNRNG